MSKTSTTRLVLSSPGSLTSRDLARASARAAATNTGEEFVLEHLSTAPTVPAPLGKYAHAVTAPAGGRTIYISGQVGMEEHEQRARPDLDVQTTLAFENIERVLAACGSSPQSLVKLTTFLKEGPVDGFLSARDRVYARWFPDGTYPAHSLAKVSALVRPDLLVEIEAVAHIPKAS